MLANGCQLKLAAEKSCLNGRGEGRERGREGQGNETNQRKMCSRGEREASWPRGLRTALLLPPPVRKQAWTKSLHALCPLAQKVNRPQPRDERASEPPGLGLPTHPPHEPPAPQLCAALGPKGRSRGAVAPQGRGPAPGSTEKR